MTIPLQQTGTLLDKFEMPPAAKFLGFEFIELDRENMTMRVHFEATKHMLNPRGSIQGGFLTAMLDEVMGSMILALTQKGPASMDLHTQFLRPAHPGQILGEAKVTHLGKSTAFTEGTLFDEEGKKLAFAVQTQKLLTISGISNV